jgi:hypothetical protein
MIAHTLPGAGPGSNTSESTGVIKSILTEPGRQAERNVQASEDRPRYEVWNNLPVGFSHLVWGQ